MRADEELLAAYCDGVTELSPDERKRVEELLAADPALRADEAATRQTIGALRELAPEGVEPDWTAMERAIRDQVGPTVPRMWWRPWWRWLAPATALASVATSAILVLDVREPADPPRPAVPDAGVVAVEAPAEPRAVALWLDGSEIVLDDVDDALFDDVDEVLLDGEPQVAIDGLLTTDLAWVDELDDAAMAYAEQWLDERKKS